MALLGPFEGHDILNNVLESLMVKAVESIVSPLVNHLDQVVFLQDVQDFK